MYHVAREKVLREILDISKVEWFCVHCKQPTPISNMFIQIDVAEIFHICCFIILLKFTFLQHNATENKLRVSQQTKSLFIRLFG